MDQPSWPNRQRHQAEILDGARSNRAEGTLYRYSPG
ncbi:MAG: hypothetical protein JWO79_2332 [Actinomycetia bacterium]|nr:hypothetical protein [Actinomycetes bacterium]MDQ1655874.1 hypothetical protein [Cryptosporangiaceae bacterium]